MFRGDARGQVGREARDVGVPRTRQRQVRGGLRLVVGLRVRPVGPRCGPVRPPAGPVRVGVLDDEAEHGFRRLHGDLQAHRRASVVQVDEARPTERRSSSSITAWPSAGDDAAGSASDSAAAGHVGRDDAGRLRQRWHDVPEHPRGVGRAVQQQQGGAACVSRRQVGEFRAARKAEPFSGRWVVAGSRLSAPASASCQRA